MTALPNPLLYQLNIRVRLTELSEQLGRPVTLDDISDSELKDIAAKGFDWVWLLSVWQTGPKGQQMSRENKEWRKGFEETLKDLKEDDIHGSGFAIADYTVHSQMGGTQALAKLRERMRKHGLKLLLDFVPNHTAIDHGWVRSHPEYYIAGTELDLKNAPHNYIRVGDSIFAHGRDPYFPGWSDTLQLNYANPSTQQALTAELLKIAGQCDAVRCDMAMLVLPEIFERTWGKRSQPFWTEAIKTVRQKYPDFVFMAEVYWDMESRLQELGFDYTYDKRLYDLLRDGHPRPVREHLIAPLNYQQKMARFLENHDEPRAASIFSAEKHKAAAVITFLSPGMRFFQQGQLEGRHKHISPHLIRAPKEPVDQELKKFYDRLLSVLRQPIAHKGKWRLLECKRAWDNNWTSECFICFAWESGDERLLVAVNYAPNQSQCFVELDFDGIAGEEWRLQDQLGDAMYIRGGIDLTGHGLYLDLEPWQAHVFSMTSLNDGSDSAEGTKLLASRGSL